MTSHLFDAGFDPRQRYGPLRPDADCGAPRLGPQQVWAKGHKMGRECLLGPPVLPLFPLFGGGFPYQNGLQKRGYPYSNLSTGGPSLFLGCDMGLSVFVCFLVLGAGCPFCGGFIPLNTRKGLSEASDEPRTHGLIPANPTILQAFSHWAAILFYSLI